MVQFLFSFVSIRTAKFSFAEKAVLVTQSSMCLRDNIKQIMLKFHTTKFVLVLTHWKADGLNIWYIWMILKLFNYA